MKTTKATYCENLKRPKTRKEQMRQRVAIAKDVISMINSQRLVAANNHYLRSEDNAWHMQFGDAWNITEDEKKKHQVKKVAPPGTASVCAIGAVFVATLDKYDELTMGDMYHPFKAPEDEDMLHYLRPWFSADELRLLECVFELDSFEDEEEWELSENPDREEDDGYWHWRFKRQAWLRRKDKMIVSYEHTAEVTLLALMRHIVRHKGLIEFMPKKMTPLPPTLNQKA